MEAQRPVRWVSRLLPMFLMGVALWLALPAAPARDFDPNPSVSSLASRPRESLPLPIHDEATCAFCQAAAFAPQAGNATHALPIVRGNEQPAPLSHDDSLFHSGSA